MKCVSYRWRSTHTYIDIHIDIYIPAAVYAFDHLFDGM